eukprot:Colp12_sorted_trinity150504_noHs@12996
MSAKNSTEDLSKVEDKGEKIENEKAEWLEKLKVLKERALKVDNEHRRELYSEVELLRLDYEDKLLAQGIKLTSTENLTQIKQDAVIEAFDEVRKLLAYKRIKYFDIEILVRLLACVILFAVIVPLMVLTLPLRLIGPVLKALNIPKPLDVLQVALARGWLLLAGVELHIEGREAVKTPTIAMFSHASNLDPTIVMAAGPIVFKWIAKKSLFYVPVFGQLLSLAGHIPIARSNIQKAKESLAHAVSMIHRWGSSICVAPEGTRSKTGQLAPFKKGPFHMAVEVKQPVTPICIIGAYELWPPGQLFVKPGIVGVRFLSQIPQDKKENYNQLAITVRRAMLKGLQAPMTKAYDPEFYRKSKIAVSIVYAVTVAVLAVFWF